MTDRYEKIREALAMRPTPGPWEVVNETDVFTPLGARNAAGVEAAADDGWHIADCDTGPSYTEGGKEELRAREKEANAALIAACDPDTIRELLEERDALAEALAAQQHAGRVHDLAAQLVDELDGLGGESDGVSGLHLNGDVAAWDDLLPGGRFDRLSSLDELRAALNPTAAQENDDA